MKRSILSAGVLAVTAIFVVHSASAQKGNRLAALDTNNDGTISRQEALSAQVQTFRRMDDDGDGELGADDFARIQPEAESGQPSRKLLRARRQARERWIANLDRDGDARVSLDEYQAAMTPYFDRLDGNSDGVLDGSELQNAIETEADR